MQTEAIVIVLVEWLVCLVATSLSCLPLFDVDLQDARVLIYRQIMYKTNKTFMLPIAATAFITSLVIFGVLIFCTVPRKQLQVRQLANYIKGEFIQ